jgi:hypothetical protein
MLSPVRWMGRTFTADSDTDITVVGNHLSLKTCTCVFGLKMLNPDDEIGFLSNKLL